MEREELEVVGSSPKHAPNAGVAAGWLDKGCHTWQRKGGGTQVIGRTAVKEVGVSRLWGDGRL